MGTKRFASSASSPLWNHLALIEPRLIMLHLSPMCAAEHLTH